MYGIFDCSGSAQVMQFSFACNAGPHSQPLFVVTYENFVFTFFKVPVTVCFDSDKETVVSQAENVSTSQELENH
jgi:hypothetical protein